MDNHDIVNLANASIRTEEFEDFLRKQASFVEHDRIAFTKAAYSEVERRLEAVPDSVPQDALICRYLSIYKFVDFLTLKELFIPRATRFDDDWECRVPNDYDVATRKLLYEIGVEDASEWLELQQKMASAWHVSCWTELQEHFDDSLMWNAYAGSPSGVGITIRYKHLLKFLEASDSIDSLYGGRVSYTSLKLLPFNKHPIYRNEHEVRFAFRREEGIDAGITIGVDELFSDFGIRLSPACSERHVQIVETLWETIGGCMARIQRPGR